MMIVLTILLILLILTFLVVIHELGHFLVAKKFGIKVLEFGFGIPPRVFGVQKGETLISLNWLPIGGFVRLLGEDEDNPKVLNDPRSFSNQNVWKRIAVVCAGVTMNLLAAFIIYTIFLAAQKFSVDLPLITPHHFVGVTQTKQEQIFIQVDTSDTNSPAMKAGIKGREQVISVNDQSISSEDQFIKLTKAHEGQTIKLVLEDDNNQFRTYQIPLRSNPKPNQGALGVLVDGGDIAHLQYQTPLEKIFAGPIHSFNIASYSVDVMGYLISMSMQQHSATPISYGAGGPIALGYVSYQILKLNDWFLPILNLVASVSLTLAIVNILPFPALDGGRVFFLLVEAVFRRRVNPTFERYVHAAGMGLLLCLMVLITYSDFNHFILNH